jgi:hypothetical protein
VGNLVGNMLVLACMPNGLVTGGTKSLTPFFVTLTTMGGRGDPMRFRREGERQSQLVCIISLRVRLEAVEGLVSARLPNTQREQGCLPRSKDGGVAILSRRGCA